MRRGTTRETGGRGLGENRGGGEKDEGEENGKNGRWMEWCRRDAKRRERRLITRTDDNEEDGAGVTVSGCDLRSL